jgi:hypothetical protein
MRKLLILLLLLPMQLLAQRKNVVYDCTFDNGRIPSPMVVQACCSYSQVAEADTTRFNRGMAYHFHLNQGDPLDHNGKRSELSGSRLTQADGWYGYSVFIPHTYVSDPIKDIITQYHNVLPDTATLPSTVPISLRIQNDHYYIFIQWSATNDGWSHDGEVLQDLGPVTKDAWTDLVWHIKWSFLSDGVVQLWKNGVLVVNRTGPNCYNDGRLPYFKCGEYKPDWKHEVTAGITSRDVYFDDIRIASSGGNYNSVVPGVDSLYITSVKPNTALPGTTVTITGGFLNGATGVGIGNTPAASFKIINSTTIKAVVPNNAIGKYITVTKAGVTDTLKGFTPVLLSATLSGSGITCQGGKSPYVFFKGHNGTPPYTFTYNINNGAPQTVSSINTSLQTKVAAPTDVAGSFVYTLLQMKDSQGNTRTLDTSTTITVNPPGKSTTRITINQSALPYKWNGKTFKAGGTHTVNLTSSSGCDSLATLVLTVNKTTTSNTAIAINSSELPYSWNGAIFSSPGVYDVHLTNGAGSDSIATLALTLNALPDAGKPALLINAYPNPSVSGFTLKILKGDVNSKVKLEIRNILGKLVYKTGGGIADTYTFGESFAHGVYMVQVINGKFNKQFKLIKQD